MRTLVVAIACALITISGSDGLLLAPSLSPSAAACSPLAGEALDDGRIADAQRLFSAGLLSATSAADVNREAQCNYYIGATAQLRASSDGENRASLLRDAVQAYEAASKLGFTPTSLVVRLARAYSDLGRTDDAGRLYQDALSAAGKSAYSERKHLLASLRRNYADLLAAEGDWRSAVRLYRQALADSPTDEPARLAILTILADRAPEQLPDEIWNAAESSQTLSAEDAAFSALKKTRLSARAKVSLAAAIVASMARQYQNTQEFDKTKTGGQWLSLADDRIIGRGAQQLLGLYRRGPTRETNVTWWSKVTTPYSRSPLGAFRELLRTLARASASRIAQNSGRGDRNFTPYLVLAENMAPKVVDFDLWEDLLDAYGAANDREDVARALQRWERLLDKTVPAWSAAEAAHYHLHAARVLKTLGWREERAVVFSVEYQLDKAAAEAAKANDASLLAAVSDERSSPADTGSRNGLGWSMGSGDCTSPHGSCAFGFIRVPELLVSGRVAAAANRRRIEVVRIGCGGLQTVGTEPLSSIVAASLKTSLHLGPAIADASWPRRDLSRQAWVDLSAEARRRPLDQLPYWATSGLWLSEKEFLVLDSLRRQLLTFGIDGRLRRMTHRIGDQRDWPFRLRLLGPTSILLETAGGMLEEWNLSRDIRYVRTTLRGRSGPSGTLRTVFDWTPAGTGEVVALGEVERRDGSWFVGLVRFSRTSRSGFKVLWTTSAADTTRSLYGLGNPYLVSLGRRIYFLDLQRPLLLYEVGHRALTPRMSINAGMQLSPPRLLALESMSAAPAQFQTIERWRMPSGLYASDGHLFVLVRTPAADGKTEWQLWQIDPTRQVIGARLDIPSSAHQLTLIPGKPNWAVLEKEAVIAAGIQRARSLLIVPNADLMDCRDIECSEKGGGERSCLPVVSAKGRLCPASTRMP
jgi:tetratricopeptide (TPR) repeat protein